MFNTISSEDSGKTSTRITPMDSIRMTHTMNTHKIAHHTLGHPLWLAALATLVLNDHVFKAMYPGLLTGKLSDVAGLFIVPALLATLLRIKNVRSLALLTTGVGVLFAAINVFEPVALLMDQLISLLIPFHTTTDPTDVLCLPALFAGFYYATSHAPRTSYMPVNAHKPLVVAGAAACLASGTPPELAPFEGTPSFTGSVTLLNKSNEMHRITIQELSSDIELNCNEVSKNPGEIITRDLFLEAPGPTFNIPLFSGEELAVNPAEWFNNFNTDRRWSGCSAFMVTTPALNDIIVFYGRANIKTYYHNIDVPKSIEASPQTIVIQADYSHVEDTSTLHTWREHVCPEQDFEWDQCIELDDETQQEAARIPEGTRYSWESVNNDIPLFFPSSSLDRGMPLNIPARCRVPDAGEALAWEDFRDIGREFNLDAIEQGLDGCHTLQMSQGETTFADWTVCAPYDVLQPLAEEIETQNLQIRLINANLDRTLTESSIAIRVENHTSIREIILSKGANFPSVYDIYWKAETRDGCAPIQETCGEVSLPVDLRLTNQSNVLAVPGQFVDLSYGKFFLVRAVYKPVFNWSCDTNRLTSPYVPTVDAVVISTLEF